MLEAFDNCFAPVFIGVHDVLDSQVVQSRPSSVSLQSGLPISSNLFEEGQKGATGRGHSSQGADEVQRFGPSIPFSNSVGH